MVVRKIKKCVDDYNSIVDILLSDHVIDRIDCRSRSIEGIRRILKDIGEGDYPGYGAFEEGKMVGFVYGHVNDNCWNVHIAFDRHQETLKAVRLIEGIAVKDMSLNCIKANMPKSNKAPQLLFSRLGAKRIGFKEDIYMSSINKYEDCVTMMKEY